MTIFRDLSRSLENFPSTSFCKYAPYKRFAKLAVERWISHSRITATIELKKAKRKPIVHRIKYYRMSEYRECTVIDIHSRVHTLIVNHSYFLSRAYTFVPSSIFRHFDEKSTRIARYANYLSRTASGSKRFKRISGRDSAIMFANEESTRRCGDISRNFDLDDRD